jgi:hypothetical protein
VIAVFSFEMASSVVMDGTPEEAFEIVERAAGWPEWSRVVTRVRRAPAVPWLPGAQLTFSLRMAGREIEFDVRVTRRNRPLELAWASTRLMITAHRTIRFEALDGIAARTRVTDQKRFSSTCLPIGLAYPREIIRRMTDEWLTDLKRAVESGRPE